MTKHTPGPWEVGPVDDTIVTHIGVDGLRYEVANISGDYNEPELWSTMEANARLIALAPDMLELLTRASVAIGYYGTQHTALKDLSEEIDALIAKATTL